MSRPLRIATRGSKLALWQAEHVQGRLRALDAARSVELVVIRTTGDKILDRPLAEIGGKGLFTKEIEEALLDGRADVAVHSMKDLPAGIPDGLALAAIPPREDPRDALLVRPGLAAPALADLPRAARVGTSSLRRMCQLKELRPDLDVLSLRGNVDTRLRRLAEGAFDAIVLASAGLRRLGLAQHVTCLLEPSEMLPAIGQGALAIEARADDLDTRALLFHLDHTPTTIAVTAERAFLARLEGGCRTPMAAHARLDGDDLIVEGLVGHPDGSEVLRDALRGEPGAAADLGRALADRLLARGAAAILSACTAPA